MAFRIELGRLLVLIYPGVVAFLFGVILLPRPGMRRRGLYTIQHAMAIFQQIRLAMGGGLVIEREGIRRHSDVDGSLTRWSDLNRVRNDPAGLVLQSTSGEIFMLSTLVDDFWPALRWLSARLK